MARASSTAPTVKPLSLEEKNERQGLIESIRTKLYSAEKSFYEIGAELGVINKKRLYRDQGTFEQFVRKHFGFSRRRAYVLMEIARKFAPERALDGESKLRAGLEYLRTTPEQDRPLDLGRIEFEIPDGKNTKSIRWKDATADDIERATRILRRKLRKENARIPREARSLRAALERQVRDVEIGLRQPSGHEDLTDLVATIVVPYVKLGQTFRAGLKILQRAARRKSRA